jgi:hypothetical protein
MNGPIQEPPALERVLLFHAKRLYREPFVFEVVVSQTGLAIHISAAFSGAAAGP